MLEKISNNFKNFKLKLARNKEGYQKTLDHKLVYNLNKKRTPNFRQLKRLPQILSSKEKKTLIFLFGLMLISASFWSRRFFYSHVILLPTAGGTYTEGLVGSPVYINPILQTTDAERDLNSLIFSGLMKRDKKQQLIADLAESYEISEDQKNYTFKLRQDVIWHDGEKFNADDVVFTVESIQNPKYKSPLFVSFGGVMIKKIDDYTVKFALNESYAPFLNILTVGILPEHLWSNVEPSSANLSKNNLKPIGTGAWKFFGLAQSGGFIKNVELEKFKGYYKTAPYLDKLIFKFYPDFVQAIDALKNKNIQGLGFISQEDKDKINKLKYVDPKILNLPQYTAIFFNQKNNNSLRDVNVRKALAFSIDKNLIVEKSISSDGETIDGPILRGFVGYNPNIERYEFDVSRANKILDDNKWEKILPEDLIKEREEEYVKEVKDFEKQIADKKEKENTPPEEDGGNKAQSSGDSEIASLTTEELEFEKEKIMEKLGNLDKLKDQEFYRKRGDQVLKIKLTTIDRSENIITADLIKKMWSKIGAELEVEIVDKSRIQNDIIKSRNYESLLFGEVVGFDPDPYPFWHSSQNQDPGLNLAIFSDKEVDQLLEDARKTDNEQSRNDKYVHFQNILTQELPAIFLYSPTYVYPISEKIKGFDILRISLPSDRFNNIDEWYIETTSAFKR
ncbi:MAG: ABC transporter substrate-binding protein [bacterium]